MKESPWAKNGGSRQGAGRPSLIDEELRARVMQKSWDIISDFYLDPNQPLDKKIKTAEHLAGKSVPQNVNVAGGLTHNHFLVDMISKSKVSHDQ